MRDVRRYLKGRIMAVIALLLCAANPSNCFADDKAQGAAAPVRKYHPLGTVTLFGGPITAKLCLSTFDRKWAVVVGIDRFRQSSWDLQFAGNDASDFRQYLTSIGFRNSRIRFAGGSDATLASVNDSIRWLARHCGKADLAVIYLRTRGLSDQNQRGKGYLLTSDSDPDQLRATSIQIATFLPSLLAKVHARAVAVIIDADNSDSASWVFHRQTPPRELLPVDHVLLSVCSCAPSQNSYESKTCANSIFTHDLISELKRQGDIAPLGSTAGWIRTRVASEVMQSYDGAKQTVVPLGMTNGELGFVDVCISAPEMK
jgi:hypothetical protein